MRKLTTAELEAAAAALVAAGGNRTVASNQLGISTATMQFRIKAARKAGIKIPDAHLRRRITTDDFEALVSALATAGGNRKVAAKQLGIAYKTLKNRITAARKAGFKIPDARRRGRKRKPDPISRPTETPDPTIAASDERTLPADLGECLPKVRRIALKMCQSLPSEVDVDDLVQEGFIALMAVAKRFDESKGFKFWTYAAPRVRGGMLDFLRSCDHAPRLHRQLQKPRTAFENQFSKAHGRQPTDEEIMAAMGWTEKQLRDSQPPMVGNATYEGKGNCGDDIGRGPLQAIELIAAFCDDPDSQIEFANQWRKATECLSLQEAAMLYLYGIEGIKMKSVGEIFRLSESRVSQMMATVKQRIQQKLLRENQEELRRAG